MYSVRREVRWLVGTIRIHIFCIYTCYIPQSELLIQGRTVTGRAPLVGTWSGPGSIFLHARWIHCPGVNIKPTFRFPDALKSSTASPQDGGGAVAHADQLEDKEEQRESITNTELLDAWLHLMCGIFNTYEHVLQSMVYGMCGIRGLHCERQ